MGFLTISKHYNTPLQVYAYSRAHARDALYLYLLLHL